MRVAKIFGEWLMNVITRCVGVLRNEVMRKRQRIFSCAVGKFCVSRATCAENARGNFAPRSSRMTREAFVHAVSQATGKTRAEFISRKILRNAARKLFSIFFAR